MSNAEPKKAYDVRSPIKHNGYLYLSDDPEMNVIELTDKEAKPLIDCGAILKDPVDTASADENRDDNVVSLNASKSKGGEYGPVEPDERMVAIRAAIEQLDKGDASLWLKDGATPNIEAIEAVLGWGITAAERNEAIA